MSIFDFSGSSGESGNLLDWLRSFATTMGLPNGGFAADDNGALPANATSTMGLFPSMAQGPQPQQPMPQMQPMPQQAMQAAQPEMGIGDHLGAAARGFMEGGERAGLIGALFGAGSGLFTGKTGTDRTADMLIKRGFDPGMARIVADDPGMLRAVLPSMLGTKDQTDDTKEYALYSSQEKAAGRTPIPFVDYMIKLKQAGSTRVTQNNSGENSYDKAMGESFAKKYNTITDAGARAPGTLGSIALMRKAMDDPNFTSGAGAERFALPLKQAIAAFGGDPSAAASMELFRSQAAKNILDTMGGSLGAGISNADRDFVQSQTANLGNTPAGNRALLDVAERVERRKIEVSRLAAEYVQKNGRLDAGFDRALAAYSAANPMFTDKDRLAIAGAAKAPEPAAAPVLIYNPKTRKMEPAK